MEFIRALKSWINDSVSYMRNTFPQKSSCRNCGRKFWNTDRLSSFCSERCYDGFMGEIPF